MPAPLAAHDTALATALRERPLAWLPVRPGPWRWRHADAEAAPSAATVELDRLTAALVRRGVLRAFVLERASGDVDRQAEQIAAFVDEECDIVTARLAPGASLSLAMAEALAAAYRDALPVIVAEATAPSPAALRVVLEGAEAAPRLAAQALFRVGARVLVGDRPALAPILPPLARGSRRGGERTMTLGDDALLARAALDALFSAEPAADRRAGARPQFCP